MIKQQLAIDGGEKAVKTSFAWPIYNERDVQVVADIVRSGQWRIGHIGLQSEQAGLLYALFFIGVNFIPAYLLYQKFFKL